MKRYYSLLRTIPFRSYIWYVIVPSLSLLLVLALYLSQSPSSNQSVDIDKIVSDIEELDTSKQDSAVVHQLPKLVIPSISVASHIQDVGLTDEGLMDVPSKPQEVGWYAEGPSIGDIGSAVVTGHVDSNRLREQGVFRDLGNLRRGDTFYVLTQDDRKLTYQVTDYGRYEPDEAPTEKIFGSTDTKQLNLITCAGGWNVLSRSYSHRIVVYSELVEEAPIALAD